MIGPSFDLALRPIKRFGVIGCLKMFRQSLAPDGNAFFYDQGRFTARERIALDRIARISEFNAEPLFQVLYEVAWKRAERVQL